MDDFLPPLPSRIKPFSSSTTTSASSAANIEIPIIHSQFDIGSPQDPLFSINQSMSLPSMSSLDFFPSNYEAQQFSATYPLEDFSQAFSFPGYPLCPTFTAVEMETPNQLQPNLMHKDKRVFDAWTSTKIARSKRRMARQRTLSLNRDSSSSSSAVDNGRGQSFSVGDNGYIQNSSSNAKKCPFTFITPDKKRLRVLLRKELKNSDVGSLGRIVLPKREAEENLPVLSDKEGIQVVIRDVYSYQEWIMKFKYWSNNKSRMYVLENTGEFVKQNGIEIGDSITLYEDECKNLYVSIRKAQKPSAEPSYKHDKYAHKKDNNQSRIKSYTKAEVKVKEKEEEASLSVLIQDLKQNELQQEPSSSLIPLSTGNNVASCMDTIYDLPENVIGNKSSGARSEMVAPEPSSWSSNKSVKGFDDYLISLEDCYGGLGILPEVSGFKYSLFD